MRIYLHIGPDLTVSDRIQHILAAGRETLLEQGILFPRGLGKRNQTQLYLATSDPDCPDPLRNNRGFADPAHQAALFEDVAHALASETQHTTPRALILSAHQLGANLCHPSELARLRDLLTPLSQDIRIVAVLSRPARMLAQRYAAQVMDGRTSGPQQELGLLQATEYWQAAVEARRAQDTSKGVYSDVQSPVFWLDFKRLQHEWDAVFGTGSVAFHSLDEAALAAGTAGVLDPLFDIDGALGPSAEGTLRTEPSAVTLARARQFNTVLLRYLDHYGHGLPRQVWRKCLNDLSIDGAAIDPATLCAVDARFATDLEALCNVHPGLDARSLLAPVNTKEWSEADTGFGFRATQYLAAFEGRLKRATKETKDPPAATALNPAKTPPESQASPPPLSPKARSAATPEMTRIIDQALTPSARAILTPRAKLNFARLQKSPYAPRPRLGPINEEALAAPFAPVPYHAPKQGSSGIVIVGCMKNEAPYILEWIAYHRAIGVDRFLIYTNDCDDGTSQILERLQSHGLVEHRDNSNWSGNSPQQFALDASLTEPVVKSAEWLIHIDVDEYINVRCGNGTLSDFFARAPQATNVAMTWRLFGHNGVARFEDRMVIEQFDHCAPAYCPKPHTAWGYKTMFRNIGAYGKFGCHRPNRLDPALADKVHWVNGAGKDITREALKNGWRSSRKSVGYDLIQLNHYALRSAESFLVKRQRGRALHVDRSIGLNYWIRMDWSEHRDVTIQRNLPRLREGIRALMADPELRRLHEAGVAWHHAKAEALQATPEFAELYQKALEMRLTDTERVAYALTLDMES